MSAPKQEGDPEFDPAAYAAKREAVRRELEWQTALLAQDEAVWAALAKIERPD